MKNSKNCQKILNTEELQIMHVKKLKAQKDLFLKNVIIKRVN